MPPTECRKRPRKRWAVSWYSPCKPSPQKQRKHRKTPVLSAFRSRVGQTRGLRMCSDYFNFKKLIRNQRIVGQAQKMRGRKQEHFRTKSTRKPPFSGAFGAGNQTRTDDLLITNQLLYRLSYSSLSTCTRGDIEITNQLLYRLSYTSITIWDSDNDTIFLFHRQHHFPSSFSLHAPHFVYYNLYYCKLSCNKLVSVFLCRK